MSRDRVTPELRERVLRRDGRCFIHRLDPAHQCYDAFGYPHSPYATNYLTLDHVHEGYGRMGKRAPSDERHLVAMCHSANVGVPSKEVRAAERAYLAEVA